MGANLALTLTRAAWIGVFVATLYIAIYFQRKTTLGIASPRAPIPLLDASSRQGSFRGHAPTSIRFYE